MGKSLTSFQVFPLLALLVVYILPSARRGRDLEMEFCQTRRSKLPIEGREVGGLELLPDLQDGEKILFRRVHGSKLRVGRSRVGTIEFPVERCNRRRAARERGRS